MLKNTLIKFLRIFWLFWGCGGIFTPRNSRFILRNSRIPYYVILGLDPRISFKIPSLRGSNLV